MRELVYQVSCHCHRTCLQTIFRIPKCNLPFF
uniref:Uncharacterized protein n=1 Tax=Rhizophora mucronata TaxID=61149 RepID=A0A2P2QUH5_RHIMU